jgi:phospholipase D3/4
MAFPNMGKEFYSALVAVLSCLILMMAIWLSLILRPPAPIRPSSAHVVTVNQPVSLSGMTKQRNVHQKLTQVPNSLTNEQRQQCYRTCHLELVESLPENLTFNHEVHPKLGFTHESWTKLLDIAERRVTMAAYKSSFRGRHVLDEEFLSSAHLGDAIFDKLKSTGERNGLKMEAVENYPPKDRGDNEDVASLTESGLMERRRLNMARIARSGVMHSKFLLVDDAHFYLGSANFDWRSLNQKMELGVHVERCPCLANELRILYDSYYAAALENSDDVVPDQSSFNELPALTTKANPLTIRVGDADTEVHIAASPRRLNGQKRDWDLDAIVQTIDESKHRLDIHVMDYVPLFVYQKQRRFWPVIDDALRRAVIERGVRIRFLTAALHFTTESLYALRSLEITGQSVSNGGNVRVKILNIPAITPAHRAFARERRTHRKFVINDDTLLIGTSNWSGDYFANTTGVAIVMKQKGVEVENGGEENRDVDHRSRPLIDQARRLFERDWHSTYSTNLDDYVERCYDAETRRDRCKAGRMAYQTAN